MPAIQDISAAIENGKIRKIEGLIKEALDSGADPNEILNEGMVHAMSVVGAKFQADELFVPEMLIAAKTMKLGVEALKPYLKGGSLAKNGKCVIGAVAGDLHDIGKNLVALMIESSGFEIIDLGVDVPAQKFVEAVKANPDCRIVGASALLTTTMDSLRNTVQTLIDSGCKNQAKIMIGGAPVTQAFADTVGADAYTPDAGSAAAKAVELVTA
jgi:corrinoid protein of di/trimethylamine methyltransferase